MVACVCVCVCVPADYWTFQQIVDGNVRFTHAQALNPLSVPQKINNLHFGNTCSGWSRLMDPSRSRRRRRSIDNNLGSLPPCLLRRLAIWWNSLTAALWSLIIFLWTPPLAVKSWFVVYFLCFFCWFITRYTDCCCVTATSSRIFFAVQWDANTPCQPYTTSLDCHMLMWPSSVESVSIELNKQMFDWVLQVPPPHWTEGKGEGMNLFSTLFCTLCWMSNLHKLYFKEKIINCDSCSAAGRSSIFCWPCPSGMQHHHGHVKPTKTFC